MATCTYCAREADPNFTPPMCLVHADLFLIIERLRQLGRSITVETVSHLLDYGRQNGGIFDLAREDIPTLLPPFLERLALPAEPKKEAA